MSENQFDRFSPSSSQGDFDQYGNHRLDMKHIEEPLTLQHFRKEDFEHLKDKRPIFRLGEFLLQNFNERDHFIKIIQEDFGIDVEIQCVTDQRLAGPAKAYKTIQGDRLYQEPKICFFFQVDENGDLHSQTSKDNTVPFYRIAVVYRNKILHRKTGVKPKEVMTGKMIYDLLSEDNPDEMNN